MSSKAGALFKLGRPFTSLLGAVAIFAASFVGAGVSIGAHALPVALGVIIGYIFTSASNALNDYYDREIDRVNHPERPIPSGKVSPKSALIFASTGFIVSIGFAFWLSFYIGFIGLGLVLAALLIQLGYDLKVKKTKAVGNIFVGFQTVLAFLFGGFVVGNLNPVAFMASASFLAITAREVVKDVEDIEGDVDKVSLPKMIGVRKANFLALALVFIAIALSVAAFYPLAIFGWEYFAVVLVADALFVGSMPLLFRNPRQAREMWKYAMLVALIAFIVGGVA
jgi:geranylgeranylglycerol-phosphate geranylgeranyltransferase